MDAEAVAQLNDDLLQQAIAPWGGRREQLTFLQDVANVIYSWRHAQGEAILRLSHSSHRPRQQVQAELDWINYLAGQGINACRPLATAAGDWLVQLPVAGGYFVAALFTRAPGGPPAEDDFDASLYAQIGRLIGRMHRVSRDYQVAAAGPRRPEWYEEESRDRVVGGLGAGDEAIQAALERIWTQLEMLPRDGHYHLIHGDVHAGNFHLHQRQIYLFDFDDCCYHWRIYDISNALYYALWRLPRHETAQRTALAELCLRHFLRGYRSEQYVSAAWLQLLPVLMEYRDLLVYAFLRRRFGAVPEHQGLRHLMQAIRQRVEATAPYVDLDLAPFLN